MNKTTYTIAVAGTGYVGLSNAILLSQHNKVYAVDIIEEKMCIQIKPLCCIVGVNCSHSDF